MTKIFKCKDAGIDCDQEFKGETNEEVMLKTKEHAALAHNVQTMSEEMESKCVSLISDNA
ncbi:MAG: DUF1059 domain-containing protein [bacterium]|nr:DUF1059 domain-containing protein [bacterium]